MPLTRPNARAAILVPLNPNLCVLRVERGITQIRSIPMIWSDRHLPGNAGRTTLGAQHHTLIGFAIADARACRALDCPRAIVGTHMGVC